MSLLKNIIAELKKHLAYKYPYDVGMFDNKNFSSFEDIFREHSQSEHITKWKLYYPASYYYNKLVNKYKAFCGSLDDIKWYIKHHTTHRYHYLKLSQPKTRKGTSDEYDYGWIDSDKQMVFAMFNILCNFVEKELGGHIANIDLTDINEIDRPLYEEKNKFLKEIRELYWYWTCDRPTDLRALDRVEYGDNWLQLEEEFYKNEEEMLIRLVKIRQSMWT